MRLHRLLSVLFLSAFMLVSCSNDNDPAAPSAGSDNTAPAIGFVAPGPCPVTAPLSYALNVELDGRLGVACQDSSWWPADNLLGAPDSMFTSLGGYAGNYIIVEMENEFADGDGADLVVFSIDMGDSAEGFYNVYASDYPDSNFMLIDAVRTQGNWCIDLAGTGVTIGKYIKIEQYYDIPGFDTIPACSTSYGADIDAIGVLNEVVTDSCLTFDELCEYVGSVVDTICPPDNEYRNHGEYVSCVAHTATDVLRALRDDPCYDEYYLEGVHGCVVSQRAQTDIGKKKKGQ